MANFNIVMVLPVYNETQRIHDTLSYYLSFGLEILVVDNYSVDNTYTIASSFPVRVVRKKNNGTPETEEWISWLCNYIDSDYFIFLSCSEFLPRSYVNFVVENSPKFDIIYSFRSSFTGSEPSFFLQHPLSLIGLSSKERELCCRSASRLLLANHADKVIIHDSFLSFMEISNYIVLDDHVFDLCHRRPLTSSRELHKLVDYSYNQSIVYPNRSIFVLAKRVTYELVVAVSLFLTFRLTIVQFREILARVSLHIMHFVNSTYPS